MFLVYFYSNCHLNSDPVRHVSVTPAIVIKSDPKKSLKRRPIVANESADDEVLSLTRPQSKRSKFTETVIDTEYVYILYIVLCLSNVTNRFWFCDCVISFY